MRRAALFALRHLFPWLPFLVFVACSALINSCSSSPEAAVERPARTSPNSHIRKFPIPDGWSIASADRIIPSVDFQLVKNDNDASIAVRELRPVAAAKSSLADEEICVLGNISMQNKLGTESKGRRILRAPSVVGDGRPVCVYIYSENSLLRRVVVFRVKVTIYEIELRQNHEALSFSTVIDAQTAIVKSLMNGE